MSNKYNHQPNPPSNSFLALASAVSSELAVLQVFVYSELAVFQVVYSELAVFKFLFKKNCCKKVKLRHLPLNLPVALARAVSGEFAWSACTTLHSIEPLQALTLGLSFRAEI